MFDQIFTQEIRRLKLQSGIGDRRIAASPGSIFGQGLHKQAAPEIISFVRSGRCPQASIPTHPPSRTRFSGQHSHAIFLPRAALAALASIASSVALAATTLLNVSYDVSREFYKDYNAVFAAHWKKTAGEDADAQSERTAAPAGRHAVSPTASRPT